jgi:hypothetical protein
MGSFTVVYRTLEPHVPGFLDLSLENAEEEAAEAQEGIKVPCSLCFLEQLPLHNV